MSSNSFDKKKSIKQCATKLHTTLWRKTFGNWKQQQQIHICCKNTGFL